MIILPDRKALRSRFLMPVHRCEWMPSSQAEHKDQFGNPGTRVVFRVRARLNDGHVVWCGWFEDRDDFDAFLFALAMDTLRYEREIWRLPTPQWHPGLGEQIQYDFVTTSYLTTTGTANTYNVPSDWNNGSNSAACIGAGGSGGAIYAGYGARIGTGGGGGGYGYKANITLTKGGTTTYGIGTGGAARVSNVSGTTVAGAAGGDTYFGASSYAAASVGGTGGGAGQARATSGTLSGGTAGSGKGDSSANGGAGGSCTTGSANRIRTGAGGAGGPNGAGVSGTDTAGTAATVTAGGAGDNGFGGAGGTLASQTGGNGTEYSASYGCGGGGCGGGSNTAGSGGTYGGGGGGVGTNTNPATSGAGGQGLIVVSYNPPAWFGNLAMMGM